MAMADASFVQLRSPFVGTIVMVTEPSVSVTPDTVVVLIESMKMEHPVYAGHDGIVTSVAVRTGEPVEEGTISLGSALRTSRSARCCHRDTDSRGHT
jgi:biotin carboxyl carrier protein